MKRFSWSRWLYPGLNIKRWLVLFSIGVLCIGAGLVMIVNYRWFNTFEEWFLQYLYETTGAYDYTVLVSLGILMLLLGSFLALIGLKKTIKTIIGAILPTGSDKVGDYIFQNIRLGQGPKVVVIGGGTGLSTLLRGLKRRTANLTAIVTVADDGGSSGRIREDLQMIAPGDLRNCLVALAEKEGLMEELFKHRFGGNGDLSGHSFGNLFLAALTEVLDGDVERALEASSKILKVQGRVIPSSTENVKLIATMTDGTVVEGESQIPHPGKAIAKLTSEPLLPKPQGAALQAIDEADAIILGPGSLYTSIMPNLLVDKIAEHIQASKAAKLYICNVMTQPGETEGYTVSQHVKAITDHFGEGLIDTVLVNESVIPEEVLLKYEAKGAAPVKVDSEALDTMNVRVIKADLMHGSDKAIHNPDRLGKVVMDVLYALQTDIEPHILDYYLSREDH